MGYMNSYAYFMPIHYLYQIVSIKLCHNVKEKSTFFKAVRFLLKVLSSVIFFRNIYGKRVFSLDHSGRDLLYFCFGRLQ